MSTKQARAAGRAWADRCWQIFAAEGVAPPTFDPARHLVEELARRDGIADIDGIIEGGREYWREQLAAQGLGDVANAQAFFDDDSPPIDPAHFDNRGGFVLTHESLSAAMAQFKERVKKEPE